MIRAAITCLDQVGYAETTFARIQQQAGVSRGAITHHFPNRQELVAATAKELLANALAPAEQREAAPETEQEPVRTVIMDAWDNLLNTSGGRAIVEILVATRTDQELHGLLKQHLRDWDRQSSEWISAGYVGHDPEPDDVQVLWSIVRTFLRGLILHDKFMDDPDYLTRMVDRFARIMEQQMSVLPKR